MSPDLGRVGSDFGRARGHSITWRHRRGKRARMAMIPELSVLGDSTHERISPDDPMLKKTELEQRDSRAGTTLDSTHESFADIFALRTRSWSLCSWQSTKSGSHWLRGRWHGDSVYL